MIPTKADPATVGGSPRAGADATRSRLVSTAERLFAECGIDAVSLRAITREARARNAVALQYHFEDRAGLIRAIFEKHSPAIAIVRHALLDQYEAGQPDLRALAAALVRPVASKLTDPNGGPEFLQVYAELMNRPGPLLSESSLNDPANSLYRWRSLAATLMEPKAVLLRRRYSAVVYTAVELGRRARTAPHTDDRLFVSHLIDGVTALLGAVVSEETRRLAANRPKRKSRA